MKVPKDKLILPAEDSKFNDRAERRREDQKNKKINKIPKVRRKK